MAQTYPALKKESKQNKGYDSNTSMVSRGTKIYGDYILLLAGILEREQEQSVVYGSIDFGKTVVTNDKYTELVSFLDISCDED